MRKFLLFLPVLLIVALFPLAGCGGGDDTDTGAADTSATGGGDEAQITDVITTAATTTSRDNCVNLETTRFVEQNAAKTGQAAIQDCETNDPGETDADSVDVTNIQVSGDTATADVAITGSTFDGQTLSVSLVKEGDQWKLDHFDSFVKYDAQAFADSLGTSLKAQGQLTPAQISCVQKVVTTTSASQIEAAILSGQSAQISALFSNC